MMNRNQLKLSGVLSIALLIIFSANIFGQTAPTQKCGDEEDYDAIIAEATKGIKFSAYNLQAFMKRGQAFMGKAKYDEALKDFQSVLEINPNDSKAFLYRGMIYSFQGNYDRSIKELTNSININSEDAQAFYQRGRIYKDFKNETILAFDDFSKTIALDSNYTNAYDARAGLHLLLGNKRQSDEDYNKAAKIITKEIESAPNDVCNSHIYLNRGLIYDHRNDIQKALADYNKAIKLNPNKFDIYYFRAILHFDKNGYQSAISDFTKSIELNPNFAENYNRRAAVYEKIREKKKAEDDRKKYEELSKKQ